MSLRIPNIDRIAKENPPLAEALLKVQNYVTANVTPVAGNKQTTPTFVNPGQRPG